MPAIRPPLRTANLTLSHHYRHLLLTPRTLQLRALSSTRTAHEENTYFPRNARHQQQNPQAQAPIVVVQPDHARGHSSSSSNPSTRRWPHWLLGFVTFPVAWLAGNAAYALGLIPFTDPDAALAATAAERRAARPGQPVQAPQLSWDSDSSSSSDAAADMVGPEAARLVESAYQQKERADSWERSALRRDLSAVRMHTLLIELLTSAPPAAHSPPAGLSTEHTAVRDDALLARPLVPHPPEAAFLADPARASLIRIVDGAGRNRALVLGVAPTGGARPASKSEACDALEPVWAWLYAVGEELHHAGANAVGKDLPLYVWSREWVVENSVAAQGPTFVVVSAGDVPPGFPIDTMRRVRGVDGAEDGDGDGEGDRGKVRNDALGVVLAGGSGKKAEDREG